MLARSGQLLEKGEWNKAFLGVGLIKLFKYLRGQIPFKERDNWERVKIMQIRIKIFFLRAK